MALVDWKGGLIPERFFRQWITMTTIALSVAGRRVAWMIRAPKDGVLDGVEFLCLTVTTPQTLKISFQNIDITPSIAHPDGTVDQFCTYTLSASGGSPEWVASPTITSTGAGGGSRRTVTRGELVCVVVEWNSTAGSVTIAVGTGTPSFENQECTSYNGAAWQTTTSVTAVMALRYSDGTYACAPGGGITPLADNANLIVGSATTPDEIALSFQMPFDCELYGMRAVLRREDVGCLYEARMYAADDSVLASRVAITPVGLTSYEHATMFASRVTIARNTTYRLSVVPTTSNRLRVSYYDVQNASIMAANPGGGSWFWSERTNAGAWTDTLTRRPWIAPLLSSIPDGN